MLQHWRIWSFVGHGAYEFHGEGAGENFEEACRDLAARNAGFASAFDPDAMTVRGNPLIPLDRRIDGVRVQIGRDTF